MYVYIYIYIYICLPGTYLKPYALNADICRYVGMYVRKNVYKCTYKCVCVVCVCVCVCVPTWYLSYI